VLIPSRALRLNANAGKPLPYVSDLSALYEIGFAPRHGQLIMVAGRSGSQKSGFVMWWMDQMNLSTLYLSGDMSPFTASARIASTRYGVTTDEVEEILARNDEQTVDLLRTLDGSNMQFSFGSPITWRAIDEEIRAYVEIHNRYPEAVVFDNLMDFEGAEADYTAQMETMQYLTEFCRETGSLSVVMHHASDKAMDPRRPWKPPSRADVKGGLAEKPELSLGVALDNASLDFNIAILKQRMGPQDPSGEQYVSIKCIPELTRFEGKTLQHIHK
jgi:hypothetical protein